MIKCLNREVFAFWTFDHENRLKFYSKKDITILAEGFPEREGCLSGNLESNVIPYNNYLTPVFDNNTYELFPDGKTQVAYTWDFGKLTLTKAMIDNLPTRRTIPIEKIRDYVKKIWASEVINYIFLTAGGNSDYVYTQLLRKNKFVNLFYDKNTQETLVFDKTKEDAHFYPVFWSEDFVIGNLPEYMFMLDSDLNDVIPDVILNEENKEKKGKLKEDDNPILVRYYFKK
jgi:hypothetical protein